jgi:hypothetical protein
MNSLGKPQIELRSQIRRKKLTCGKKKIIRILLRDHGQKVSEGSLDRVRKALKDKGLTADSMSALPGNRNAFSTNTCTRKRLKNI